MQLTFEKRHFVQFLYRVSKIIQEMKKSLLIFLSLFVAMVASAQRARFELSFKSSVPAELSKVHVRPLNNGEETNAVTLRLKGDKYTATVPVSESGFYEVVMVVNKGQWLTTVYSPKSKKKEFVMEFNGAYLAENSSVDNVALSSVNALICRNNRKLWLEEGMSDAELKSLVESYLSVADLIIAADKPAAPVARYMKAWAYTAAHNCFTSIPRAQKRKAKEIPFTKDDVLPSAVEVLDNETAALIASATQFVYSTVSAAGGLEIDGMLNILYRDYKCAAVRNKVTDMLLNRFLTRHNYAMDFDGGLEYLKGVVEKYELSDKYVDEYLKHKAVLVGADFPQEVVLVTPDGEEVDFSTFKGKYVYVDMWASWCGPCCREVPHLQALEKEFEGSDVVFVSVSTDADADSWRAKLKELNMHGNQLHDRDGKLSQILNVGGIPFFVVYDKEGKLHTYGALRPSMGEPLKTFLKELK